MPYHRTLAFALLFLRLEEYSSLPQKRLGFFVVHIFRDIIGRTPSGFRRTQLLHLSIKTNGLPAIQLFLGRSDVLSA